MSTKDVLTLVVATLGAAIALGTLITACLEYVRRGEMERIQLFFDLRRRLKEPELGNLAQLIDEAAELDPAVSQAAANKLAQVPFRVKRDYLGLFEEVGLAMERRLIKPEVAHYMFGYYALHCADCRAFWNDVGELNPYWDRFFRFCVQMKAEREAFERDRTGADRMDFGMSPVRTMPPGTA